MDGQLAEIGAELVGRVGIRLGRDPLDNLPGRGGQAALGVDHRIQTLRQVAFVGLRQGIGQFQDPAQHHLQIVPSVLVVGAQTHCVAEPVRGTA